MAQPYRFEQRSHSSIACGAANRRMLDEAPLSMGVGGGFATRQGEPYAIGQWDQVVDLETGELLDSSHGNFGLEEPDIDPSTCPRLGPPQAR